MANSYKNIPPKDVTRDMYDEGLRVVASKHQGYDIKPVWQTRTIIADKKGKVPDVHPYIFIVADGNPYVLDVSGQGNFMDFAIPIDGVHVTTSKVLDTSDIEDAVIIEETKAEEPKQAAVPDAPMTEEHEYEMCITETLSRQVSIKASSEKEAIEKLHAMYGNGEIVLYHDGLCIEPIIRPANETDKTNETPDTDEIDIDLD